MVSIKNFKELSFLVYGLGITGKSVVKFFKKNKINNFQVWDDNNKKFFKKKRPLNLNKSLKKIDYIVMSPGVNINTSRHGIILKKYKKKIITDLDLIFRLKKFYKSIVVTGTNGKSTTCKILYHLLKKNKYETILGGNIGTPVLNLNVQKKSFLIIEASSFQLAYSKFISPDFAILLNITNDHLDWHGNMRNYISSKFKIFENQKRNHYSILNVKLKPLFKKRGLLSKLIIPNLKDYQKLKSSIKNSYLKSDINDENMTNVFELSKILKISKNSFLSSIKTFSGLPHRYEIFLKKKNYTFINDSKATTFQATKFALKNTENIFWIVGGLPKKNDRFNFNGLQKNIIKSYIIGKKTDFFVNQLNNKIKYEVVNNIKNSIKKILKDTSTLEKKNVTVLFSPAAASFDQFKNFEKRGEKFKLLSKFYARKFI